MPFANKIDDESKRLTKLVTDVDKYRRWYATRELDNKTNTNVFIKFVSPSLIVYDKYRFYLLYNSVKKMLEPKYYYRPDYVSYNEYNTTTLWTLLLYINNIPSIEEFNVPEILVPSYDSVARLSSESIVKQIHEEIVVQQFEPVKENYKLFSHVSKPQLQSTVSEQQASAITDVYYYRQVFVVDLVTILNRYLDLDYSAVAESIVFRIQNGPAYIYGKHYNLIKGQNSLMSRISWDPVYGGDGLIEEIVEGTVIEVQYAKYSST